MKVLEIHNDKNLKQIPKPELLKLLAELYKQSTVNQSENDDFYKTIGTNGLLGLSKLQIIHYVEIDSLIVEIHQG